MHAVVVWRQIDVQMDTALSSLDGSYIIEQMYKIPTFRMCCSSSSRGKNAAVRSPPSTPLASAPSSSSSSPLIVPVVWTMIGASIVAAISIWISTSTCASFSTPSQFISIVNRIFVEPILIPMLGGPTSFSFSIGLAATTATTAEEYFQSCLVLLLTPGLIMFAHQNIVPAIASLLYKPNTADMSTVEQMVANERNNRPPAIATFQRYYLPVFWLLRTSFWMSGPFFFPVYASKTDSFATVGHIFHAGFAAAAILLPATASLLSAGFTDEKSGTMAAALLYGLGALSTQYSSLPILFAGRALGTIGTGLLNVMPEAWLSSEIQKSGADPYGRWLSDTFATAFAFDSLVAIGAGRLASWSAESLGVGPMGPFRVSPCFLLVAIGIVGLLWTDTDVPSDNDDRIGNKNNGQSLKKAFQVISSDRKIVMVGLVQCLFEASMYIFVLNQAPAIRSAAADYFAGGDATSFAIPSGTVFGCFMAACLIGSNLYGYITRLGMRPERLMTMVLVAASASLVGTSYLVFTGGSLPELSVTFFIFEVMVGIYYPSISWLRSKYLPVAERSIIMTIIAVPFNALVLTISLSSTKVGTTGVWLMASISLLLATTCLIQLQRIARKEAIENLPRTWKRVKAKWIGIARIIQTRKLVQGISQQAAQEKYE